MGYSTSVGYAAWRNPTLRSFGFDPSSRSSRGPGTALVPMKHDARELDLGLASACHPGTAARGAMPRHHHLERHRPLESSGLARCSRTDGVVQRHLASASSPRSTDSERLMGFGLAVATGPLDLERETSFGSTNAKGLRLGGIDGLRPGGHEGSRVTGKRAASVARDAGTQPGRFIGLGP